ncbi:MAG: UvrB/UvrC motif-containing protein [Phycisphaerales bacterium]|nr:UvrB/UvrC motif-containing protein [Phycisphaeraceae bacterium]
MSEDIGNLLRAWPYEPGKLNVRLIPGQDGEPKIQLRLDLGILQMHTEGRPDGQKPFGHESLLEYHEARLDEATFRQRERDAQAARGEPDLEPDDDEDDEDADAPLPSKPSLSGGTEDDAGQPASDADDDDDDEEDDEDEDAGMTDRGPLTLTRQECRELRDEALQYYHRYMALLVLEDFEGVVRDTSRNLRVLDLCAKHAGHAEDREALEPFRAYITMMRARALASQALKDNEPKAAINAIDEGLAALRNHFATSGQENAFDTSGEVQMLRNMREALVPKLPVSPAAELRKKLADAVKREAYEEAARIRDQLKGLGEGR